MALPTIPMQLLLNKRIGRTFAFAALILILLSLAGYWSASPRLRDNARDHLSSLPSWLAAHPSTNKNNRPPAAERDPDEPEFYSFETTSRFSPVSLDVTPSTKTSDLCASFPHHLLSRIQPVLKIGHGDARDKLEAQLDSVSACFAADELLVFSDLAEKTPATTSGGGLGARQVIDVLADLPQAYYGADNKDFESYVTMQAMRANGTLDVDKERMGRIDGWRLDKYKFLPGIERAWDMRPGRDWYVFYETDTYVVWDNLFRFLGTMDPDKPHYIGSPSPGRVVQNGEREEDKITTWFANGGPGYVLSRGAVERLLKRRVSETTGRYLDPPLALKWLDLLRSDCCGDSVVGWTLWNASVPVEGYWPLFNPHSLHAVPYSDHYWCQPVVTMHKTTPEDMVELWRWEHGRRRRDKPLLYQDLWSFRHPGDAKTTLLKDWDNGGWADYPPPPEAKIDSAAACRSACEASDRCLQYLWKGLEAKECVLMFQIRYGVPRKPDTVTDYADEKQPDGSVKKVVAKETRTDYTSGWMTERFARWRDERRCEVVQWVGPSITRVY